MRILARDMLTDVEEYALNQWYMRSVAEANRLLVEAEVAPLTNLVDGFDENGRKEAGA